MNFSEESLVKIWQLYTELRKCQSCSIHKPIATYHGIDNTCNLCRKMLRLNIKYSHKIKFSAETMLANDGRYTVCRTCNRETDLCDMADYSYECKTCWLIRQHVELAKYSELEFHVKCRRCETPKSVVHFPIGRLTCKSCICDMNANEKVVD